MDSRSNWGVSAHMNECLTRNCNLKLKTLFNFLQVEDKGQYVCSDVKHFIPANYGRTGDAFMIDGVTQRAARRLSLRQPTTVVTNRGLHQC